MAAVTNKQLEAALQAYHDDLKENHLEPLKRRLERILEEIRHSRTAEAHDTREMKELLMALQDSVNTLDGLVKKVVTDGQTTQKMIVDLKAEIDRLVEQGSANQTELDALKVTAANAQTSIDSDNVQLQALDDTVQDPANPIDPNTPIGAAPRRR